MLKVGHATAVKEVAAARMQVGLVSTMVLVNRRSNLSGTIKTKETPRSAWLSQHPAALTLRCLRRKATHKHFASFGFVLLRHRLLGINLQGPRQPRGVSG